MEKNKKLLGIIGSGMVLVFVLVFVLGLVGASDKSTSVVSTGVKSEPDKAEEDYTSSLINNADNADVTPADRDALTLSFIGDCIIGSESGKVNDGNFSYMAENSPHGYFFSRVVSELSADDFTIANMECVITDRELEKTEKDYDPAYWYKTPTSNTDILTLGSVEVANVVNNHTGDYGEDGYEDTIAALKSHGLQVGENLAPLYIEKNGIKIGLLCCNLWSEYHVYYIEEALESMQSECEYSIVFFHGGTEGTHQPDNYKIDACRSLAESGLCDLIVGSHPHVLQPMEIVNNVPILYSLGNFCYSASNYPDNQTVIFRVELEKEEGRITTKTELIPCYVYTGYMNNYQPVIMSEGEDKNKVLDLMSSKVERQEETTAPAEEIPASSSESDYAPGYEDEIYPDENFSGEYPVEY